LAKKQPVRIETADSSRLIADSIFDPAHYEIHLQNKEIMLHKAS
jgi:hypothetical protein